MKHSALALAVGVALAAPAHALIVNSSTATTSAYVTRNGLTQSASDGPGSSATSHVYGAELVDGELVPSSGEAYAYGDSDGHSLVYSVGPQYTFTGGPELSLVAGSSVHQSVQITNDSSVGRYIGFSFLISEGYVSLGFSNTYGSNSVISAGYSADIQVNGQSIWNSAATLRTDAMEHNGATYSGTYIGDDSELKTFGNYYWNPYDGLLNLGWLNPGESLTLDYYQSTFVDVFLEGMGYSHTTSALFRDPFEFEDGPLFTPDNFVQTTTPVPEPETVALMGAGLAALAFRRKKAQAKA